MSSRTKIVVLHMKEIIYTCIFLILAIVLAVLLYFMFGKTKDSGPANGDCLYHAGVYTSPITLNDNTFDVQVTVDENHINDISLVNLSESTTAMYPLMQPTMDTITSQIYESQSTENITYQEENKYTSILLLDAIHHAIQKAKLQ